MESLEIESLEQKAVELIGKIEALAEQQAQPAWDTLVQLARVSAIGDLFVTIGLFVLTVLFGMVGRHILKTFNKKEEAYKSWRDIRPYNERNKVAEPEAPNEDIYFPFVCIAWTTSGFLAIATTIMLFQVWMWVALVNPELSVARKIVEKFLQ